jgi:hypothetical protein
MGSNQVLDSTADEFVREMAEQFPTWFEKLNLVVGMGAITFSVLCFKSDYPEIYALLSLIVVFGLMASVQHYFPPKLKHLRNKNGKTNLEIVILKGVESHYLGLSKMVFGGFIYWLGLLSLVAVASGFKTLWLSKILPWLI